MAATSGGGGKGGVKSPKGFKITSASRRSTPSRRTGATANGVPIF